MRPPVPPLGATITTTTTVAMLGAVVAAVAGAALSPAILPPVHAAAGEPGTLAFSFGEQSRNAGPYKFLHIEDAAIAPDGKIVVLDRKQVDTIRVFHPNGTLYFGIDFANVVYGHTPDYVSVAPDGNIFAHTRNSRDPVIVFSPNGTHISTFRPLMPGSPYPAFGPIVFAPNGNFVMRDNDFGYAVFRPNGTHAFSFGQYGGYHGELASPGHFDIGPDGKIFVADHGDSHIEVFHPNGTHASIMHRFAGWTSAAQFAVGPAGEFLVEYDGVLERPDLYYLYYPNGTRAATLTDAHSDHHVPSCMFGPTGDILCFRYEGPPIRVFNGIESEVVRTGPLLYGPPWPPAYGPPAYGPPAYGPPAAPPLSLTAAAPSFEFGAYGEGPGEFLAPRNIAVGPGGVIAVSDAENNRVQLFHPNGTFAFELGSRGSGPGELIGPYGITFGPNGLLVVADVGNHRVQVFRIQ